MTAPVVPDDIDPKILRKLLGLTHPQMRIVIFYLTTVKDPEFGDAVVMTAEKIAEEIGMNRSLLAKTLPRLLEVGWLCKASRHGNVQYYGLGSQAEPKKTNVVPLRRTA